ncbi:tripartite motif-containing protein 2-like [Antedon mediterranea]|uniref:tripartite motif-containing protein 2-like n=1 Tax=Antedon mediterranea TaxID=105859 RepID=UPI003AF9709B
MSTGIAKKKLKCSTHCENDLQFFCSDCKKSACKDCEHIHECFQNQHDVVPIPNDEAEEKVIQLIKKADGMMVKLEQSLDTIVSIQNKFENNIKLCRSAIEMRENKLIEKLKQESRNLISDLNRLCKERQKTNTKELEDLDLKKTQLSSLKDSLKLTMDKSAEQDNFVALETETKELEADVDAFSLQKHVIPIFITSPHLNKVMDTEGIGKIAMVDSRFNVAKTDRSVTVTKGESFAVKVSSLTKDEECKLVATLTSSSGEESTTDVKYYGNGEYRIRSSCTIEGNWKMKITVADENIKGSPVFVKVEKLGLVRTIGKISDYIKGSHQVSDVMAETNGCVLVASASKEILRFNQTGSFVNKQLTPLGTYVNKMHKMNNGNIVYDYVHCVVMCDEKLNTIRSFGEDTLKAPKGLDVDENRRVLYVADGDKHCIFKFNIDNKSMLGKIGSKGSNTGKFKQPRDVAITKEGNIVVADTENDRIQIFNADGQKAKVIIGHGKEDGKVIHPSCVTVDADDNLIISSEYKVQLFDKNGVFKRRIDHKHDGLQLPLGSSVISYRPRRLAVANYGANDIKFFNY